jgi:FkbM family methyltransferase
MSSEALKNLVRTVVPRSLRNWLRSPSRTTTYILDAAKFSLGARKTLRLAGDDWSIKCHPYAYRSAFESQVLDPEQNEEFRVFRSYCHKQMFLFDIGAHFGVFSLAAAHSGGTAIAVDPSPTATRMIARQATLNGLAERIRVLRVAASDKDGTIELLSSGAFSYGYFKFAKNRLRQDLTEVPSITIDHMTRDFGAPTHIKIDVEGHEAEVLRGAKATLNSRSPLVFLELHNGIIRSEGGDPNPVLDELLGAGYALYTLGGTKVEKESLVARPIVRVVARRF